VPTFQIDKYEVTVALYRRCVDAGSCGPPIGGYQCTWDENGKEDHPVDCMWWNSAGNFCAWAGKRLCSESEWEKAARGTDGRKYPWGNETATCEYAVMNDGSGQGCGTEGTMAVGSKPAGASPYGALDMAGNAMEWVEDDYHPTYTEAPTDGSAWVDSPRAGNRSIRGGSFARIVGVLYSSFREYDFPWEGSLLKEPGVRCCRTP